VRRPQEHAKHSANATQILLDLAEKHLHRAAEDYEILQTPQHVKRMDV
jgi:hypothetical protein